MTQTPRYPEREGRQLELKQELSSFDGLLRTIVAFLNDIGGIVIIGVEDGTREVRGLSEHEVDRCLERIPQSIADAIEPHAPVAVRTRTIGGNVVVEIEAFPGGRKPYLIRSEGIPRGVYVRVGSHTRRASEEQVHDLIRAGKGGAFDAEPVSPVTLSDLDTHLLNQLYRNTIPDVATLRADKLLAIDPVTQQDFATVAAIILVHPHPCRVLPAAEVLFTHFKDDTTAEILRTEDISAPLSTMVYYLMNLIEPSIAEGTIRKGAALQPRSFTIPPLAIREALLNALVHRRYTAVAPVKISLFSDRLEILSPGNFPGPIDLDELDSGVSYFRNPTLAHFARRLGLVERRGLGFPTILNSCRENNNPPPRFVEGSDYIKVTLFRRREKNVVAVPLPAELTILESFRKKRQPLTVAAVKEALDVSAGTARARIKELMAREVVFAEGKGRATRYRWR